MNCKFLFITLALFVVSTVEATVITNLGSVGETYPVVEPDVVTELKQKAAELDREKDNSLLEQMKEYQPANLQTLPRSLSDKTFLVDMAYTLDRDLVDGDGKIIYPRGYTFNPLDSVVSG